jgi:hypothetical protein
MFWIIRIVILFALSTAGKEHDKQKYDKLDMIDSIEYTLS